MHYLLLTEDFEGHPLIKSEAARKGLVDVMPQPWLVAVGLAQPEPPKAEKPQPQPATVAGAKE